MVKAYAMIPVYLLVPILYWLVFRGTGLPMYWGAFGIGAAGWWIAYLLRLPILLVLKKPSQKEPPKAIVYFSGPLEEGVRLVALAFTGMSMRWALSIGQGWAAIEVVYAIVTAIALTSLKYRTDEKAMQAKEVLQTTGMKLDASPWWGVMERVFASGFHIGSTLLIAWNPWLVIAMVPIHTVFNLAMVHFMKKSIAVTESMVALFSTIVLAAGLLVFSL